MTTLMTQKFYWLLQVRGSIRFHALGAMRTISIPDLFDDDNVVSFYARLIPFSITSAILLS